MSKVNVGYSYTLTGDLDIELKEFEEFCANNSIEPYLEGKINPESLHEYLLEEFDLIEMASDGNLDWVEESISQINAE